MSFTNKKRKTVLSSTTENDTSFDAISDNKSTDKLTKKKVKKTKEKNKEKEKIQTKVDNFTNIEESLEMETHISKILKSYRHGHEKYGKVIRPG